MMSFKKLAKELGFEIELLKAVEVLEKKHGFCFQIELYTEGKRKNYTYYLGQKGKSDFYLVASGSKYKSFKTCLEQSVIEALKKLKNE